MIVQEKRVQKYVETLDAIRAKNAAAAAQRERAYGRRRDVGREYERGKSGSQAFPGKVEAHLC